MRIFLQDPQTQDAVEAVLALHPALAPKLVSFVYDDASTDAIRARTGQVGKVMETVARALLLAKTVLPCDEAKLAVRLEADLASARGTPALAELALSIIAVEQATEGDLFRDPAFISDELFKSRLGRIKALVTH